MNFLVSPASLSLPQQSFMLDLFKNLIDSQTWDDSGSASERTLRSSLLLFACVRNYTPCVTKAKRLFNLWRDSDGQLRSEPAFPHVGATMMMMMSDAGN